MPHARAAICASRRLAAALIAVLAAGTGSAAANGSDTYLDDRSDGGALIESLYNAINRHEYSRAWSYFDPAPAASYEAYVDGFASTDRVELRIGEVTSEGAAGSLFWTVPVAIRTHLSDGTAKVFAGCYVLRLAQPTIQEPPFRPLHIERGTLHGASGALDDAVPESCPP